MLSPRFLYVTFLSLLGWLVVAGQENRPFVQAVADLDSADFADWITVDDEQGNADGVLLFRREFNLSNPPDAFEVHVSGDPRYRLYVNGELVGIGPAVGDRDHWNYESLDLAPWLQAGDNVIAASVWNPTRQLPARQITVQAGFVLAGPDLAGRPFKTDRTWLVKRSAAHTSIPQDRQSAGGGYIAGSTELFDAASYLWGWNEAGFDAGGWRPARVIGKANHGGLDTWKGTPWGLIPRPITALEMRDATHWVLRRAEGVDAAAVGLESDPQWPIQVPPHSEVTLLLDHEELTMGFTRLGFSGGKGAEIELRYQEALFRPEGGKGNRDVVAGKVMKGIYDRVRADGGAGRVYEPQWIRVFRYAQIKVATGDEPLQLDGFAHQFVGYPLERRGSFASSDPSHAAILDASWRTMRVCALESYMDCPYYEQVQYIGDTRIQALISLYMSGDDALMRNAILQFHHSRQYHGLTKSAHPTAWAQIIPPFSLLYIGMVHDYLLYRGDREFLAPLMPGIAFTLEWFLMRIDANGLMGPLPFWNHVDGGAIGFNAGSPPGSSTGGSIHQTLLLAYTLDRTVELMEAMDFADDTERYRRISTDLKAAARRHGFDKTKGLYAETAAKEMFSQHTNAFAILSGAVDDREAARIAEKIHADKTLVQGTLYFQFYVFEAYREAGRGDLILANLDRWEEMLEAGLTTFPEHGVESRSDAHAWAGHPLFHLLASTAGVRPAAPGFTSVEIKPALGDLAETQAEICHPAGMIRVHYQRAEDGALVAQITLPETLSGSFQWEGETYPLKPGAQTLQILTQ